MRRFKDRPSLSQNLIYKLCKSTALLTLLIALIPNAISQTPPATQPNQDTPTLKAESNLVVVRVVVRDKQGDPLTGLKKEDFKLFDRGKEQPILQFEESGEQTTSAASPSSTPQQTSNNPAPAPAAPSSPHLVVFYFDDLNSTQGSLMRARDAADRFIQANLQPSDEIAIFSSEKLLTDFTSDPAKIHQALTQLNGSSRDTQAVRHCPDLSEYQAEELLRDNDVLHSNAWQLASAEYKQCTGRDPDPKVLPDVNLIRAMAREVVDGAAVKARANLEQFEQVTKYVSRLPGERTILFVSPGFLTGNQQERLDRIIDEALRAQVVINALDPKGLTVMMREQDASRRTVAVNQRALGGAFAMDAAADFQSADVLNEFAQGTGGRFFHNDNDLDGGFAALAGHPDTYTLAFAPTDLKRDGKFHELKVTLAEKRQGASIMARRGYFASDGHQEVAAQPQIQTQSQPQQQPTARVTPIPNSAPGKATSPAAGNVAVPQMDDRLRDALLATADATDLPITLDLNSEPASAPSGQVSVLIHLDANALPFRKDGDQSLDTVTFAAAVFDKSDKVGLIKQRSAKLDLTAQQLDQLVTNGIDLTFTFPVDAGAHKIRAAVMESEGHKIGTLSKNIDSQ